MGMVCVFPATMTSANSLATWNLGEKAWLNSRIVCPSMPSSTALDMYISPDGTTYYQLRNQASTSSVQVATFTVPATLAANGGVMPVNALGKYVQIRATDSSPTAATTFYMICSD